jgi:DNA-binding NarL/FixJ family response regulator
MILNFTDYILLVDSGAGKSSKKIITEGVFVGHPMLLILNLAKKRFASIRAMGYLKGREVEMDTLTKGWNAVQLGDKPMKILIADDHELFRDGLRHVLTQLDGSVSVVEACDYPQAISLAETEPGIGIVLLDLGMPGMPWNEGIQCLRKTLPSDVPVIVLSASDDRRHVLQAVNLGAAGFIPKTSSSRVMLSALKLVMSGGVYLPPALLDQSGDGDLSESTGLHSGQETAASFLTPRQREVLTLLGQGKSNKEIARVLQLAEGTVKLHVTAILKALNVNNRTRAVVAASQMGLTKNDPASFGR